MIGFELNEEYIIKMLNGVDWDFPGSGTQEYSINSLHWFPGNFIPQIPNYLIKILSKENDLVMDPFCGSGTTGVEAALLGRNIIMSDISSAAILVSKGKVGLIRSELKWLEELISEFRLGRMKNYPDLPPANSAVEDWLHPTTFKDLRCIWGHIQNYNSDQRSVLELAFTDTLFKCAAPVPIRAENRTRRRHHWGWVADNVLPKRKAEHDAFSLFSGFLEQAYLARKCSSFNDINSIGCEKADARFNLLGNPIDLIVTSPPYLGVIDYVLSNRLTYYWMGWNIPEEISNEIGARRYRDRKAASSDYLNEMILVRDNWYAQLKVGGFLAIVIGSSQKFATCALEVCDIFGNKFDLFWGPNPRRPSRQRVSNRTGQPNLEYICVFRRV